VSIPFLSKLLSTSTQGALHSRGVPGAVPGDRADGNDVYDDSYNQARTQLVDHFETPAHGALRVNHACVMCVVVQMNVVVAVILQPVPIDRHPNGDQNQDTTQNDVQDYIQTELSLLGRMVRRFC
jgi:hypothetical protein